MADWVCKQARVVCFYLMVILEAYLVFVQNQGDIDLIKMDEKQRCGLLIL